MNNKELEKQLIAALNYYKDFYKFDGVFEGYIFDDNDISFAISICKQKPIMKMICSSVVSSSMDIEKIKKIVEDYSVHNCTGSFSLINDKVKLTEDKEIYLCSYSQQIIIGNSISKSVIDELLDNAVGELKNIINVLQKT